MPRRVGTVFEGKNHGGQRWEGNLPCTINILLCMIISNMHMQVAIAYNCLFNILRGEMDIRTSSSWKSHRSIFLLGENSHVQWRREMMHIWFPFLPFHLFLLFYVHLHLGAWMGDSLGGHRTEPEGPDWIRSRLYQRDWTLWRRLRSFLWVFSKAVAKLGRSAF